MTLATLSQPGDFAKISYNHPLKYITALTGYVYNASGSGVVKLEFRWSTTNLIKNAWMELNNANLAGVTECGSKWDPNDDLWIDFRITLISGGPIQIHEIAVEYTQDPIAQDKFLGFKPVATACQCGNITALTKIENFSFQPYKVNPAVALYSSLSFTINQLFGHSVEYARAVPLMNGRDVTLKEWTLYDVDDPCCIKVLVPNNEFPDNKINFGPMGLDFEMPFEVHIDKAYFEDIFGIGTGPQKRDIVYFPLTNRIYEVQSSYLYRDFMNKPVYWKVNLAKYAPKSNRTETKDHRDFLDSISRDTEELFGAVLEADALEKTKPQQYDPKIGSSAYDPTRLYIAEELLILSEDFKNYYTLISNSQYDLGSSVGATLDPNYNTYVNNSYVPFYFTGGPEERNQIVYRSTVDFGLADNRAFTAWFKDINPKVLPPRDQVVGNFTVISITPTHTLVQFSISATRNYIAPDLIKFSRPNGIVFYGEYDSSPAPGLHRVKLPKAVYDFLQAQHSGWATMGNFYSELTFEKEIFYGYDMDNLKGWKLSLIVGRYMKLKLNDKIKYFILPINLTQYQWYAVFLNISNECGQIALNVWTRKWNPNDPTPQNTTDLENIYANAISWSAEDLTVTDETWKHYRLLSTPLIVTNLRLFDSVENDTDKQQIILNQNIVEDSQLAIIIDNALPRLKLPWIAKTK
jgi:hypothetical protein